MLSLDVLAVHLGASCCSLLAVSCLPADVGCSHGERLPADVGGGCGEHVTCLQEGPLQEEFF